MNLLFSCIGRRGYLADWFREQLEPGERIIGTSNSEWTPAFHSCDKGVLMPDVKSEAYVPTLLELCRKEEIRALLSFLDADVDAIARHREEFEALGVVPLVPEAAVSRIALDKLATSEFLRAHGLPAALTFVELDAARTALAEGRLQFPVFVKPRLGFASQNLFLARNHVELDAFFAYAPDMIVQERLKGPEYGVDILNDLRGRVVSVVVKHKVLMRAGETDQAETVDHPAVLDVGVRLGEALGHVGPLDVDLMVDGDRISVLELNLRFGGGYPAAHLAGADFPRKIVDMLRGRPVEADIGSYAKGVRMMKDYLVRPAWRGAQLDLRGGAGRSEVAPTRMKLAIMQPYLFPYIGYFQLIQAADRFVVYDDVNYIKGGWINRNRILIGGEARYFTLPPRGASPNKRIYEIPLGDVAFWRKKFLKALQQEYRRAPHFEETFGLVEKLCHYETGNLAEFLLNSLKGVCEWLGIETEVVPSSRAYGNAKLRGQARVLDICLREKADVYINPIGGRSLYSADEFRERGVELRFLESRTVEYPQDRREFVPQLSIVDVMMFNPKSRIREMLGAYSLV